MKEFDVVALGELLVDFTRNGDSAQGNPLFEANPGGAPANVLAMLRKLGKKTAFIGKVGQDGFGNLLADTVRDAGIDIRGLKRDPEIPTTLAIVNTFPGLQLLSQAWRGPPSARRRAGRGSAARLPDLSFRHAVPDGRAMPQRNDPGAGGCAGRRRGDFF